MSSSATFSFPSKNGCVIAPDDLFSHKPKTESKVPVKCKLFLGNYFEKDLASADV